MIRRLIILLFIVGCEEHVSINNGIKWENNLDSAFVMASKSNKIIMIDFMAEWCPPCKKMDKITFSNTNIIKKSNEFIPVRIDVDKQHNIAEEYNGNARKYGGLGIPNILFLDKEKNRVRQIVGFHNVDQLMGIMDSVLLKLY
ncbi:MAG: thioredoxin family protein [Candidatus Marinimicrobia bacterium]|jgi:thiol:disulfide interchange protein DsbD|nr:thioredoxin family protein [Candidatus Neomarinimicrobiota bacterium]